MSYQGQNTDWEKKCIQAIGVSYLATCIGLTALSFSATGWSHGFSLAFAIIFALAGILVLSLLRHIPAQVKEKMTSANTGHIPLVLGLGVMGLSVLTNKLAHPVIGHAFLIVSLVILAVVPGRAIHSWLKAKSSKKQ